MKMYRNSISEDLALAVPAVYVHLYNSPVRKLRLNIAWCKKTLLLLLQGELTGHPCEFIWYCRFWTDATWEELNRVVQCN